MQHISDEAKAARFNPPTYSVSAQSDADFQAKHQGLTAAQLNELLNARMGDTSSPVSISPELSASALIHAPFFQGCLAFLKALQAVSPLKPTSRKSLPRQFVDSLVENFLDGKALKSYRQLHQRTNETSLWQLHEARLTSELAGLVSFQKNRFVLDEKALPLLLPENHGKLYRHLICAHLQSYNIQHLQQTLPIAELQFSVPHSLYRICTGGGNWISVDDPATIALIPYSLQTAILSQSQSTPFWTLPRLILNVILRVFRMWGLAELTCLDPNQKNAAIPMIDHYRITPLFNEAVHVKA